MSADRPLFSGLNQQLLLLTLLPIAILSLALSGYFLNTRLDDAERAMIERGQTLARLLASSAEFSVLTENHDSLKDLSKAPILEPDVADIVFLNSRYEITYRSSQFELNLLPTSPQLYQDDQFWYFIQPVITTGIPFLDSPELQNTEQLVETAGWIAVVLSQIPTVQRQRTILLTGLLIMLFCILVSFYVAYRFTRRITDPMLEITKVVEELQEGHLSSRASINQSGELLTLPQGVNRLAQQVESSTIDMNIQVDTATRRLQSAMHHLEQQNQQLVTAKERAIEANQAKDEFLARMSHELRTPLTSVLGFSKLLKENSHREEQAEPLRIINQASMLLLSIVDDILDFSKLQKNAIELERIDFNLETALLDILEMQATTANAKGLELTLLNRVVGNLDVVGDPTRLKQVLTNLTANAIKFTDSGSVIVSLDCKPINAQQSLFKIAISDTGIGISKDQFQNLFQAFSQADTSITRRFGGSGLGLVIARKLTELMGGRLDLHSELGKGTTVELQIAFLHAHETTSLPEPKELHGRPLLVYDTSATAAQSLWLTASRLYPEAVLAASLEDFMARQSECNLLIGLSAQLKGDDLLISQLAQLGSSERTVWTVIPNGTNCPQALQNSLQLNKPLRIEHLSANNNAAAVSLAEEEQSQYLINAVIAEDNYFNRLLISKILKKHQIQVFAACNGAEAVELVNRHQPDIVVLDVHMPVMDGLTATYEIRKRNEQVPILSLTANIIKSEHQKLADAGTNKVILKPINDKELISSIFELTADVLEQRQAEQSQALAQPAAIEPSTVIAEPEQEDYHQVTDLSEYGIDSAVLDAELDNLLAQLVRDFGLQDIKAMREIAHQLVGLAGLYQIPSVEITTLELQDALHESDIRTTWQLTWRLLRIVNSRDYQ